MGSTLVLVGERRRRNLLRPRRDWIVATLLQHYIFTSLICTTGWISV